MSVERTSAALGRAPSGRSSRSGAARPTSSASTAWVRRSGTVTPPLPTRPQRDGEVPEEHVQAHVDARLVDDRHVHGDVARAADGPPDEPPAELRVVGEMRHEGLVQDRQPGGLQHAPARSSSAAWAVRPRPPRAAAGRPRPSSSAPKRPSMPTRLTSSPSSTSRPIPRRCPLSRGVLRQRPVGIAITRATQAAIARSRSSGGIASARPGSSSSTRRRSEAVEVGADAISVQRPSSRAYPPGEGPLSFPLPTFVLPQLDSGCWAPAPTTRGLRRDRLACPPGPRDRPYDRLHFSFAGVAQLVERLSCKQGVTGSSPVSGFATTPC